MNIDHDRNRGKNKGEFRKDLPPDPNFYPQGYDEEIIEEIIEYVEGEGEEIIYEDLPPRHYSRYRNFPPPPPPYFMRGWRPNHIDHDDDDIEEIIEYIEDDNDEDIDDDSIESSEIKLGGDSENETIERLRVIQDENLDRAKDLEKIEKRSYILSIVKIVGIVVVVISIVSFAVFEFLLYQHRDMIAESEMIKVAAKEISADSFERREGWTLLNNKANNMAKNFFKAVAGVQFFVDLKDFIYIGEVNMGGNSYQMSAIVKPDRTYLTLKTENDETNYLIANDRVSELETKSASGKATIMTPDSGFEIKVLIDFASELYIKCFMSHKLSNGNIVDEVRSDLDGVMYNCISVVDSDEAKYYYYLDKKTNLLMSTIIKFKYDEIRIDYSRYKDYDSLMYFPSKRDIYINNKLFATVKIDSVQYNQEAVFPE